MVDGSPVVPLLDDFLAIKQHGAEDDTSGVSSSFLAVVEHEGISHILWERTVELMLQIVQVIISGTLAKLVIELGVVFVGPVIDPPPRVGGRGRRGMTL